MIKFTDCLFSLGIAGILFTFSSCRSNISKADGIGQSLPKLSVDTEEVIYEYENPDNGSHPKKTRKSQPGGRV